MTVNTEKRSRNLSSVNVTKKYMTECQTVDNL